MEVFHMLTILLSHMGDLSKAFFVVRVCAAPMISCTAVGVMKRKRFPFPFWCLSGIWRQPLRFSEKRIFLGNAKEGIEGKPDAQVARVWSQAIRYRETSLFPVTFMERIVTSTPYCLPNAYAAFVNASVFGE